VVKIFAVDQFGARRGDKFWPIKEVVKPNTRKEIYGIQDGRGDQ
jgi:hypothetical protein